MIILFILLIDVIILVELLDFNIINKENLNGKKSLELIQSYSLLPNHGACWLNALEGLEDGCKILSEDMQHKLSLKFTNCFLLKTGRASFEKCPDNYQIEICLSKLSSEQYQVYTEFFSLTINICQFIYSQNWQKITHLTVNKLSETSQQVAVQIEQASMAQYQMLQQQIESINLQNQLISSSKVLQSTIDDSKSTLDVTLNSLKISASLQNNVISNIYDKITFLQSLMLSEIFSFCSIIRYVGAILISYIITSTQRTSGARFPLLFIATLNLLIERFFSSSINDDSLFQTMQYYYRENWLQILCFLAFIILIWNIINYKDYTHLNYMMLQQIQQWQISHNNISDNLDQSIYSDIDDSNFTATSSSSDDLNEETDLLVDLKYLSSSTPSKQYTNLQHLNHSYNLRNKVLKLN